MVGGQTGPAIFKLFSFMCVILNIDNNNWNNGHESEYVPSQKLNIYHQVIM